MTCPPYLIARIKYKVIKDILELSLARLPTPGNLRAVQLQPGHAQLANTVRHLGIEVDNALEIAKQTEV